MRYKSNGQIKEIKPVDSSTGLLYDKNSSVKPKGWSIVTSEAQATKPDVLYFVVSKDYIEQPYTVPININITNNAYSFSASDFKYDGVGPVFKSDTQEIETLYGCPSQYNNYGIEELEMPINTNQVAITANFINNTGGIDPYISGYLEVRDSGQLIYWWGMNQTYSIKSGERYILNPDGVTPNTNIEQLLQQGSTTAKLYITVGGAAACLDGETLIKKDEEHYIYIKDLQKGDIILDRDGKETKIEKIVSHIDKIYYTIKLEDNSVIKATSGHKFLTDRGICSTSILTNGLKMILNDGSRKEIKAVYRTLQDKEVYEIKTTSNSYQLYNGIICECEVI